MESMLDKIRTILHRAIEPPVGDPKGGPIPQMLVRRLNRFLGEPLCSAEELEKRRRARAKLQGLRGATEVKLARDAAPVVVYFEKDRNQRLLERVEELLNARGIVYRSLDVTGDEPTIAFVTREARCEEDDLPIVYVAGAPVGGYNELVDWDVSGRLKEAVFGS